MNLTKKHILPFILPLVLPLGAMTLLVAALLGFQIAFAGKVAPGTTLFANSIALQNLEEIQQDYTERLAQFEQSPITIFHQTNSETSSGQNYIFSLAELGVTLEKEQSLADIPIVEVGNFKWGEEVKTQFTLNKDVLKNALEVRIIDLSLNSQNAELKWNASRGDFDILPEQPGWHVDLDAFIRDLTAYVENLSPAIQQNILTLRRIDDIPQITAVQLETARAVIKERVETPLTLKGPYDKWKIDWKEHMDWLEITPAAPIRNSYFVIRYSPLAAFVSTQIAPSLEVAPQDVTITRNENGANGAITFEGTAADGIAIDYDTLAHLVNLALAENLTTVEIPTLTTPGRVNAPPDLQARGIKELVATGYSGFKSSPPGRRHNIGVAIKRFDGLLVEPGAIFSFGEHLGEVDGSTGYVKELVIREGETIPEYGGGVCQVSSTLFRAILFGGFPIVERHPHSYAVTYYAYPLGWGLDATVYPPAVDLKFKNDMPTPILIQAFAEGNEATFKFYGTKDGRTVTMDGPYITDRKPAPPPIYATTDSLSPGVKEKKDTAHNGFTATWYRTVTYPADHPSVMVSSSNHGKAPSVMVSLSNRDEAPSARPPSTDYGLQTTDLIISPYIPWPERWLVGREET